MSTTSLAIVTKAMRLFGIIDQGENPGSNDIVNNVAILSDLLRSEHMDGACQYLMTRATVTVPAGVTGSISSFNIGTAGPSYLLQADAVAVKSIWCQDINTTVNRPTRQGPTDDVVKTTSLGRITKWHQERQADGSVLVTVWQPPRVPTKCLIEYGGRIGALTSTDGSDIVTLPPEGAHDAALLLGATIMGSYGRSPQAVASVLSRAQEVDRRWRDWARGQQWLIKVRS